MTQPLRHTLREIFIEVGMGAGPELAVLSSDIRGLAS
jgi:hypothetical protein